VNTTTRSAPWQPPRPGHPEHARAGIEVAGDARREIAGLRSEEPWYPEAAAALALIQDGAATEATWAAITPLTYSGWDQTTQAYDADLEARRTPGAAAAFVADVAFDPPATRAALVALETPVLVLAGA
jgi:proline iminopeptidase